MRRLALASVAVTLLSAGPALGGNVRVGLDLRAGGLALQAPTATAVAGHTIQVPVTIADARGTGAGWTLKLNAGSTVTVTSISARCALGSTCTLPRSATGNGILRAAPDSGMGVIQLVVSVSALKSSPLSFSVS